MVACGHSEVQWSALMPWTFSVRGLIMMALNEFTHMAETNRRLVLAEVKSCMRVCLRCWSVSDQT